MLVVCSIIAGVAASAALLYMSMLVMHPSQPTILLDYNPHAQLDRIRMSQVELFRFDDSVLHEYRAPTCSLAFGDSM